MYGCVRTGSRTDDIQAGGNHGMHQGSAAQAKGLLLQWSKIDLLQYRNA